MRVVYRRRTNSIDKFDEGYVVVPSGCWIWIFGQTGAGYGTISHAGKTRLAHRYSYERFVGKIPDGLTLDHLCRTPGCVNWRHLEAVTLQENVARAAATITHCPKGHAYSADNTLYRKGDTHRKCRTCNREGERVRIAKKRAEL